MIYILRNIFLLLRKFLYSIYFIGTLLAICSLGWACWNSAFSFSFPWSYTGDGWWVSLLFKSIIDSGSFLTNPYLGFPDGYQLYDFPIDEGANFAVVAIESLFTKNYVSVLNGFYLLTFVLTTWTSLYACKKVGLNKAFSLFVSLLFAFAPYHVTRGLGHIFLSAYYAVPLYILMILSVAMEENFGIFSSIKETSFKQWLFLIFIIGLLASSGIYYAFFTCYFLIVAAIYAQMTKESKGFESLQRAFIYLAIISSVVFLNILPNIVYNYLNGSNFGIFVRGPAAAEEYGLKIIQLLLPSPFDGFSFLQSLRQTYETTSPLVNENQAAALGIIGAIGFLSLLFIILFSKSASFVGNKIKALATVNLSAVLLGTIGGFGVLFAYTVSSTIRGYNRVSIFILYFSLLALALGLQKLITKYFQKKSILFSWLIVIPLMLFGLYNQMGKYAIIPSNPAMFQSDKEFIQQIEKQLPNGSAIFQLPYIQFPETAPLYQMLDYEEFRGYLHSHNLKWSAGALKGRPSALWQEMIGQKPLPVFLQNIIVAGFAGLYIDCNGYKDHGNAIVTELRSLLNIQPLVSPDHELVFFDLRVYAKKVLSSLSPEEIKKDKAERLKSKLPIVWKKGFYGLEVNNNDTWRWSEQVSSFDIINATNKPQKVSLSMVFTTSVPAHISIKSKEREKNISTNSKGVEFVWPLTLNPGKNTFYFATDAPRVNAPGDPRSLYFAIHNFLMTPN